MQDITNSQDYNRYSYAFNNPLKYVDPSGYMDIDDAISSLLDSDNGGSWNVGDANVTFFESSDEAKEFTNDNLNQLTEGGSSETQRSIVTIYNSSGNAYFYDKNSGEVWNPGTLSFTPGADLFPGQMFYDSEGNFANVFLPGEVEITGQAGGGVDAIDVASASVTGFGFATAARYRLEWEYLKQARINRALSGDFSRPIKQSLRTIRGIGTGTTILSAGFGIASFMMSDQSWGDYGQLGVSFLSTGLTLGGTTAPIGIGLGAVDAFGGLNGFYNYLDAQQNFYNNTGGILVPVNGFPAFIRLK